MKYRELRPVVQRPLYFQAIEERIIRTLKRELYLPLVRELGGSSLVTNSYQDLLEAIASGRIQFVHGHFEGRFNSTISKELMKLGASWDRKHSWWSIGIRELTPDMQNAIGTAKSRFERMAHRVDEKLSQVVPEELAEQMRFENLFDASLGRMDRDFDDTLKSIEIKAQLTKEGKKRISEEYTKNMQRYVQDWSENEISKLRRYVQANTFSGFRMEAAMKTLQESYGQSQSKAKFLARQETNLMLSSFRKARYLDVGAEEYRWHCAPESSRHKVRDSHKKLYGKIFSWDNPPITDEHGHHNHPGEDFGCWCIAIPIVRF